MQDRKTHLTRLLLATAIHLTMAPAVMAAEDDADNGGLEEIIVSGSYTVDESIDTATGLGLTIMETPQSVTVMTAQRILDMELDTITDVVANAVGVSFDEVDNVRNTFHSRGFEINNYQIDGVPINSSLAGASGETVYDVSIYERIEFVRGATGLLSGAGDPSASINLVRKHANATELRGYLNIGTGSWENRQVQGDIATPLNDSGSMRARAVAKYEAGESFTDLFEDEKIVLYGVFEADITPSTLLRLGASHQDRDPKGVTWGALPSWFSDGTMTDWPRSKTTAADWTRWHTKNTNLFANLEHTFANDWMLQVNYNHVDNSRDSKLLYLSGVLDPETGEGLSSFPYKASGSNVLDSIDANLKGHVDLGGQRHEFVLGMLHSQEDADAVSFSALAFPPVGNFFEWDGSYPDPGFADAETPQEDLNTEQTGFYGATRLSVSDRLKVILGGRISRWKREGESYGVAQDYGDSGIFVPYAGVLYDVTDHHRVYASYTEIFQPQNAQAVDGAYLDPIVGKSMEAGLKSSFFNDVLQTSLALFRIEQDNLAGLIPETYVQGREPDNPDGFPPVQASEPIEGATSEGFEFEIVGQPVMGWNINFGFSTFDAEDAAGDPFNPDHPRTLVKLFTTYSFLDGGLEGLTIGGGVNWQSRFYSESVNPGTGEPDELVQPSYALVSLMARYDITAQLSAQLNVRNLLDEKYFVQAGFFDQYRYGAPRNFSLGMTYHF